MAQLSSLDLSSNALGAAGACRWHQVVPHRRHLCESETADGRIWTEAHRCDVCAGRDCLGALIHLLEVKAAEVIVRLEQSDVHCEALAARLQTPKPRCRRGRGEPGAGADVTARAQSGYRSGGRAQFQCRCGRGGPSPSPDLAAQSQCRCGRGEPSGLGIQRASCIGNRFRSAAKSRQWCHLAQRVQQAGLHVACHVDVA